MSDVFELFLLEYFKAYQLIAFSWFKHPTPADCSQSMACAQNNSAIVMAALEIPPLQWPYRLLALSGLSNGCPSCSGNQSVSSSDLASSARRVTEFRGFFLRPVIELLNLSFPGNPEFKRCDRQTLIHKHQSYGLFSSACIPWFAKKNLKCSWPHRPRLTWIARNLASTILSKKQNCSTGIQLGFWLKFSSTTKAEEGPGAF